MPMPKGHQVHSYDRVPFGLEMQVARQRLGLALGDLGDTTGINKGSLQAAESGRRSLPLAAREAIVAHLERRARAGGIGIDGVLLRSLGGLDTADPAFAMPRGVLLPPAPTVTHSWRQSLLEGHRLSANFDPHLARTASAYAEAAGTADSPGAKALATAWEAHTWWKEEDIKVTTTLYRDALAGIGLGDLPPDTAPSIQGIETRVGDELELTAYAQLARLSGSIHHTQGDFARAVMAYTTWERVGRILHDSATRANAFRYIGKSLLEQGTFVDSEEIAWRIPRSDDAIRRALGYFRKAREVRGTRDGPDRAEDWRQELRARGVLLANDADRAARRAPRQRCRSRRPASGRPRDSRGHRLG